MDIGQAKEELRRTILAYTERGGNGQLCIPAVHQRPLLLMGPPGVGKTGILTQLAQELKRFVQYAVNVWGVPQNADNPDSVALEGIRRTKAFFKSLNMPTSLKDIGADGSNCRNMARDCIALYGTLGQFVRLGEDDVYQILMSAVD